MVSSRGHLPGRPAEGEDARVFTLERDAHAVADRLPDLLLEASRIAQTVAHGVHGRRRAGPGETFWQFRTYEPQDSAQLIDWRRSASSDHVYVREREVTSLENAVRAMTSLPASVFGLTDRGVIREGAVADLAIFDPAQVRDKATYTEPHQLAEGMAWVLVNGVPVVADGQFTSALPGKVLAKGQPTGGASEGQVR